MGQRKGASDSFILSKATGHKWAVQICEGFLKCFSQYNSLTRYISASSGDW
jgi:hypothetical protein